MRYGPCLICVILTFLQWWLSNVAYHFFISKNYSYAFLSTVCLRSAFFNIHKYSYIYAKLETNFIFLLFKTLYVFHRDVLEFINFIIKYSFYANYFGSALWRFHLLHRIIVCWYNWINWVSIYKARTYSKLSELVYEPFVYALISKQ